MVEGPMWSVRSAAARAAFLALVAVASLQLPAATPTAGAAPVPPAAVPTAEAGLVGSYELVTTLDIDAGRRARVTVGLGDTTCITGLAARRDPWPPVDATQFDTDAAGALKLNLRLTVSSAFPQCYLKLSAAHVLVNVSYPDVPGSDLPYFLFYDEQSFGSWSYQCGWIEKDCSMSRPSEHEFQARIHTDAPPPEVYVGVDCTPDAARLQTPYAATCRATGYGSTGDPSVLTLESGDLPPGIALGAIDQYRHGLHGTPTQVGTWTFTVKATNSAKTIRRTVTVEVTKAPTATELAIEGGQPYVYVPCTATPAPGCGLRVHALTYSGAPLPDGTGKLELLGMKLEGGGAPQVIAGGTTQVIGAGGLWIMTLDHVDPALTPGHWVVYAAFTPGDHTMASQSAGAVIEVRAPGGLPGATPPGSTTTTTAPSGSTGTPDPTDQAVVTPRFTG